jgi:hypothetical protein
VLSTTDSKCCLAIARSFATSDPANAEQKSGGEALVYVYVYVYEERA